jgi:hypothetical protein
MSKNKGTSLLINEPPLQVLPSLAKLIGLNEALALQQLHWLLENPKVEGVTHDGYKWIYNSYEEWQERNFPFWSTKTIQRVFASLESMGLVISRQADAYDRTKQYRIDYDHLDNLSSSNRSTCPDGRGQVDQIEEDKMAHSNNESEKQQRDTQRASLPTLTEEEEKLLLFKGDYRVYPQHLWDVAKALQVHWGFALPEKPRKPKKGSGYTEFCDAMEGLKTAAAEFNAADLLKAVRDDFVAYMKKHNGIAPFTVGKPYALITSVGAKAREMRVKQAQQDQPEYSGRLLA